MLLKQIVCLFRLTHRVTSNCDQLGLNKIKNEELKTQGHLTFFLVDLPLVKIVMFLLSHTNSDHTRKVSLAQVVFRRKAGLPNSSFFCFILKCRNCGKG